MKQLFLDTIVFAIFIYLFGIIPAFITGTIFAFRMHTQKYWRLILEMSGYGSVIAVLPFLLFFIPYENRLYVLFSILYVGIITGGVSAFTLSIILLSYLKNYRKKEGMPQLWPINFGRWSIILFTFVGPLIGTISFILAPLLLDLFYSL